MGGSQRLDRAGLLAIKASQGQLWHAAIPPWVEVGPHWDCATMTAQGAWSDLQRRNAALGPADTLQNTAGIVTQGIAQPLPQANEQHQAILLQASLLTAPSNMCML